MQRTSITIGSPQIITQPQNKYREAANALFEKLNSLQQSSEKNKSQNHSHLIDQLNQKENKFMESQKIKTEQYNKVIKMVSLIEREIQDQRNENQKIQRAVENWIQAAERGLQSSFQKLEKQRLKSEASLQEWIDSKLQSFVLKNKKAWSKGSVFDPETYKEEIEFTVKEHKKFLEDFGKQCIKLKKEISGSLKELIRLTQEEVSKNDEEQVRAFLKNVHIQVTGKLKWLHDQRTKTEQKVLNVLERVIQSCLPKTLNRM